MLDLNPKYLNLVRNLLEKYVPANSVVWAYGSRVTGKAHAGSDLDLVIRHRENLDLLQPNLAKIRLAFDESNLPITVEIYDWADLPSAFQEEILKNHVVIWG